MTGVRGIHDATGEPVSIRVDGGTIRDVTPLPPADAAGLPTVAPGLVDLQINGYIGHDFNRLPIPESTVGDVARALSRAGVTPVYPTVIANADAASTEAMATR